MNLTMTKHGIGKKQMITIAVVVALCTVLFTISPAFAVDTPRELTAILEDMLDYVGIIFRAVGIILAIYAVGQMVLAFKDENPDAKSKSASILVVGILLIAMPTMIDALNLTSYL